MSSLISGDLLNVLLVTYMEVASIVREDILQREQGFSFVYLHGSGFNC
jgi:hypothetical protein